MERKEMSERSIEWYEIIELGWDEMRWKGLNQVGAQGIQKWIRWPSGGPTWNTRSGPNWFVIGDYDIFLVSSAITIIHIHILRPTISHSPINQITSSTSSSPYLLLRLIPILIFLFSLQNNDGSILTFNFIELNLDFENTCLQFLSFVWQSAM